MAQSSGIGALNAWRRPSQTKIIATIGPACERPIQLERLIDAGTDVFRINTAHADLGSCARHLAAIRQASAKVGRPVGVLIDLAGPKIRLGELYEGQVECQAGAVLRFVRGEKAKAPDELTSTYSGLIDELAPGNRVLLADGTVGLRVERREPDFVECRVIQPGVIRSRQGINLPGVKLRVKSLTDSDLEAAAWAAANQVEFVGLSFVRSAGDVRELKSLLQARNSSAQVVAKIEKAEALDNLESIVEAADAVMVARGDLGVETDIAQVAAVQKQIIRTCWRWQRPVIVATQMLDSMQRQILPTRAEVTDVANAILDGADACMLSGETAIGRYPLDAVIMMHRIASAIESLPNLSRGLAEVGHSSLLGNPITEATVEKAAELAAKIHAKLIAVVSHSGQTALCLSKRRVAIPMVGLSPNPATLGRMCLYWGVIPLPAPQAINLENLVSYVTHWGSEVGFLKSGDRIVVIGGTGLKTTAHNLVLVHQLD